MEDAQSSSLWHSMWKVKQLTSSYEYGTMGVSTSSYLESLKIFTLKRLMV